MKRRVSSSVVAGGAGRNIGRATSPRVWPVISFSPLAIIIVAIHFVQLPWPSGMRVAINCLRCFLGHNVAYQSAAEGSALGRDMTQDAGGFSQYERYPLDQVASTHVN
jgi:hypothetical protein